jgi:hypothetical protein
MSEDLNALADRLGTDYKERPCGAFLHRQDKQLIAFFNRDGEAWIKRIRDGLGNVVFRFADKGKSADGRTAVAAFEATNRVLTYPADVDRLILAVHATRPPTDADATPPAAEPFVPDTPADALPWPMDVQFQEEERAKHLRKSGPSCYIQGN